MREAFDRGGDRSRNRARKALAILGALVAAIVVAGCAGGYTMPAANVTDTEAEVNGLVFDPVDATVSYWFEYGPTKDYGSETAHGSIVINDASTSSRLAALAPWVHVAVLRAGDLWPDIPTALANLGDDPNSIWITGPSKTADVEGILIEGVHGPGEQICLRIA